MNAGLEMSAASTLRLTTNVGLPGRAPLPVLDEISERLTTCSNSHADSVTAVTYCIHCRVRLCQVCWASHPELHCVWHIKTEDPDVDRLNNMTEVASWTTSRSDRSLLRLHAEARVLKAIAILEADNCCTSILFKKMNYSGSNPRWHAAAFQDVICLRLLQARQYVLSRSTEQWVHILSVIEGAGHSVHDCALGASFAAATSLALDFMLPVSSPRLQFEDLSAEQNYAIVEFLKRTDQQSLIEEDPREVMSSLQRRVYGEHLFTVWCMSKSRLPVPAGRIIRSFVGSCSFLLCAKLLQHLHAPVNLCCEIEFHVAMGEALFRLWETSD